MSRLAAVVLTTLSLVVLVPSPAAPPARSGASHPSPSAFDRAAAHHMTAASHRVRTEPDVLPPVDTPPPPPLTTPRGAREYARRIVSDPVQFACLDALWHHESGWRHDVSSATDDHGIPQAHAPVHTETDTDRWRADPALQIRWGLRYIAARYGTPCGAWGAWKSRGEQRADGSWYGGWY